MRILITGAGGMLGKDLVRAFSGEHKVYGIDREASGTKNLAPGEIEFSQVDITNREEIVKAISEVKPEAVIHTAAYTDVDGCQKNKDLAYKVNGIGTKNVALASAKCRAVMIYISTDFVFDGDKREPYLETDEPHPLSIYGKSKLEGEKSLPSLLEKYLIIRTSWLFGRHGRNFVDTIVKLARAAKELKVVDDQIGSPTYSKDLAQAIRRLITLVPDTGSGLRELSGIYHITNSGSCSWYEYASEIVGYLGLENILLEPISSSVSQRLAPRPAYSVLNNERFEQVTGYSMRPWRQALKEYLKEVE
jgi:dTDP-4-dehydrorhamnose reductase